MGCEPECAVFADIGNVGADTCVYRRTSTQTYFCDAFMMTAPSDDPGAGCCEEKFGYVDFWPCL
jgi:hypothetical protein